MLLHLHLQSLLLLLHCLMLLFLCLLLLPAFSVLNHALFLWQRRGAIQLHHAWECKQLVLKTSLCQTFEILTKFLCTCAVVYNKSVIIFTELVTVNLNELVTAVIQQEPELELSTTYSDLGCLKECSEYTLFKIIVHRKQPLGDMCALQCTALHTTDSLSGRNLSDTLFGDAGHITDFLLDVLKDIHMLLDDITCLGINHSRVVVVHGANHKAVWPFLHTVVNCKIVGTCIVNPFIYLPSMRNFCKVKRDNLAPVTGN